MDMQNKKEQENDSKELLLSPIKHQIGFYYVVAYRVFFYSLVFVFNYYKLWQIMIASV